MKRPCSPYVDNTPLLTSDSPFEHYYGLMGKIELDSILILALGLEEKMSSATLTRYALVIMDRPCRAMLGWSRVHVNSNEKNKSRQLHIVSVTCLQWSVTYVSMTLTTRIAVPPQSRSGLDA